MIFASVMNPLAKISVCKCCPMYKGKAGQRSDSSALLPRKIGVLLDLDLNVGTYVGRQPSRVAFFSDPELIRSSNSPKKWTK